MNIHENAWHDHILNPSRVHGLPLVTFLTVKKAWKEVILFPGMLAFPTYSKFLSHDARGGYQAPQYAARQRRRLKLSGRRQPTITPAIYAGIETRSPVPSGISEIPAMNPDRHMRKKGMNQSKNFFIFHSCTQRQSSPPWKRGWGRRVWLIPHSS